jgi:hypothetical protein
MRRSMAVESRTEPFRALGMVIWLYLHCSAALGIAAPRVAVDTTERDLGAIRDFPAITSEFKVANVGADTLEITPYGTSCGCLSTAKTTPIKVQPGGTEKVKVSLDPIGRSGRFSLAAVYTTNDPNQRQLKFTISGEVTPLLDIQPRMVLVRSFFEKKQPVSVSVLLSSEYVDTNTVEVGRLERPPTGLVVQHTWANSTSSRQRVLNLYCTPTELVGRIEFGIPLEVAYQGERYRRIVPVIAIVNSAMLKESELYFGLVNRGDRPVTALLHATEPHQIMAIEGTPDYVQAHIAESHREATFELRPDLIAAAVPPGLVQTVVHIVFDKGETVGVPLRLYLLAARRPKQ